MIPRPAQPSPGVGASGLYADHALIAGCDHVFELEVLFFLIIEIEYSPHLFSMPKLDRGICFWIAADLHDGQSFFCEGGCHVGYGCGFADSAFAVYCYFNHVFPPRV